MRPRLLDLFCGAGGAAMGYHLAGFEVVGVDKNPQPDYPFAFVQADALDVLRQWADDGESALVCEPRHEQVGDLVGAPLVGVGGLHVQVDKDLAGHRAPSFGVAPHHPKPAIPVKGFVAIHASPPCQAHTALSVMWNAGEHKDLIPPTRELLEAVGLPWVIENVEGAPLNNPIRLCGTSFGLGTATHELRRHRLFETSFPIPLVPSCGHSTRPVLGIYGDHARDRRRSRTVETGQFRAAEGLAVSREAMQIPWASWHGLTQAIPPAFTEWIGHQLACHLQAVAA